MRKVNDDGMKKRTSTKGKERKEVKETKENQTQDGGPHNECFSFFLIGVSIAKIYLENKSLGRLSISGGRDEWMPTGNHLNMYSEACVLCIWMRCQQQR